MKRFTFRVDITARVETEIEITVEADNQAEAEKIIANDIDDEKYDEDIYMFPDYTRVERVGLELLSMEPEDEKEEINHFPHPDQLVLPIA